MKLTKEGQINAFVSFVFLLTILALILGILLGVDDVFFATFFSCIIGIIGSIVISAIWTENTGKLVLKQLKKFKEDYLEEG